MSPIQSPDRQFTNSEIKDLFEFIGKVNESLANINKSQEKLEKSQEKLIECVTSQEKAFIEFKTQTNSTIRNRTITWSAIVSMLPIAIAVVLHFV